MRLVWHILRKDFIRLRLEWLVFLAALAMFVVDNSEWKPYTAWKGTGNLVLTVVWIFFTVRLVQGEALVDDRQWWLTRPYPRWRLLLAKLITLVILVHLPYLIGDAIILTRVGFPLAPYWAGLLTRQLWRLAQFTLPALFLAALTRNLFGFCLRWIAGTILCFVGLSATLKDESFWFLTWQYEAVMWAVLATGAAAGIWLLYRRRRATHGYFAGVVTLAVLPLVTFLWPRTVASPLDVALSPAPAPGVVLRFIPNAAIELDRENSARLPASDTPIVLPLEWKGERILIRRVQLALRGARGEEFVLRNQYSFANFGAREAGKVRLLVPSSLYRTLAGQKVHARVRAFVTHYGAPVLASFNLGDPPRTIQGVGSCRVERSSTEKAELMLTCKTPLAIRNDLVAEFPISPGTWEEGQWNSSLNPYSPLPAGPDMSPIQTTFQWSSKPILLDKPVHLLAYPVRGHSFITVEGDLVLAARSDNPQ